MFWSRIAGLYDFFMEIYNKKVYFNIGKTVAEYIEPTDDVLECACGTGVISLRIAERCNSLVATDMASGMLRRAEKKCAGFANVSFAEADITKLPYGDNRFDKVVAGNVIHLAPDHRCQNRPADDGLLCKPGQAILVRKHRTGAWFDIRNL